MTLGIFGRKVGMTHVFDESGASIPVTIVKAPDCLISQIKSLEKDSYNSIQLAYDETSQKHVTKAIRGHLAKSGDKIFRSFGEIRVGKGEEYKLGDLITVDDFSVGQKIKVTGTSIGKGFSGNQKRHNFSRGPMTHGSKNHRLPGSIGAGSTPGRVYPGKKMAGQLGNTKNTISTSEVIYIDNKDKILVLRGSLPGKKNNLLKIVPKKF